MFHAETQIHHVEQRTPVDCVIATTAIVANLPYSEVAKASNVRPGSRRIYPRETRALLHKSTGTRWLGPRPPWFRSLKYYATLPTLNVLMIRRRMSFSDFLRLSLPYHCIATKGGFVYDPERRKPLDVDRYDRSDWTIVSYYRPWNRSTLNESRRMNGQRFPVKERLWADLLEELW